MKNKKLLCLAFVLAAVKMAFISAETLPLGYGGVTVGMSVEEVKEALVQNSDFGYRGERDVSLLTSDQKVIIDTDPLRYNPYSFFKRCYFQFYKDKLYIITLELNTDKIDYHSMYTTLSKKYGNPSFLNPKKSEWSDDAVIIDLEKPLTLKYTDKAVSESILEGINQDKSGTEKSKDQFLGGL